MPPPGVAHHAAGTGLGLMRGGEGGLTCPLRLNGGGGGHGAQCRGNQRGHCESVHLIHLSKVSMTLG